MLFVVSKVVGFFAIPSNLIISIGVIGLLLLLTRYARAGRRLAFGSLILLVIVGIFESLVYSRAYPRKTPRVPYSFG